jgi:glycosyltransferase involved in cell wall biosynthesis
MGRPRSSPTGSDHQQPLRVCHVLHSIGPGGAQESVVTLASLCRGFGIHLDVIALTGHEDEDNVVELHRLGAQVRVLGLRARDPRGVLRLRTALKAARPDVVHSHGRQADALAGVLVPRLGLPRVSTLHLVEDVGTGPRRRALVLLARLRHRAGGRVLCVSEFQRERYVGDFPWAAGSASVIYNGVIARTDRPRPTPRDRRVLALGLLRPDRGYQYLVEAAALLPADVDIRIAGDGPLRSHLESAVAALPAGSASVRMLGFRADIHDLLDETALLAHPSLADALPTAVIHALASGVPVVACAVGGTPEVIPPGTGVLVPPRDAAALAGAIGSLLGDPERRAALAAAGRQHYERTFSAEAWVGRLADLYAEMTGRRTASSG